MTNCSKPRQEPGQGALARRHRRAHVCGQMRMPLHRARQQFEQFWTSVQFCWFEAVKWMSCLSLFSLCVSVSCGNIGSNVEL